MKQFLLLVMVLFAGLGFSVKAQTSGDCQMPSGEVVVSNVTATSFELSISDLSAVRWEIAVDCWMRSARVETTCL